jgi:hypothetical protein
MFSVGVRKSGESYIGLVYRENKKHLKEEFEFGDMGKVFWDIS